MKKSIYFNFLSIIILINIPSALIKRLTHVVMPFTYSQLPKLLQNLNTWTVNKPCQNYLNVGLIFFLNEKYKIETENHLKNEFSKLDVFSCFDYIAVDFFNEIDTGYLDGSKQMFEKMLKKKLNFGKISPYYIFYMEPDCIPIRKYWLNALNYNVIPPNQDFWMKGSIFRGNFSVLQNVFVNHYHINGNAIYNLNDKNFSIFYFDIVKKFIFNRNHGKKMNNIANSPYDMDIFEALFANNLEHTASYAHFFQISDFVLNFYHSNYSLKRLLNENKNSFLVHGGVNNEKY